MAFRRATLDEFWREVEPGPSPNSEFSECWNYNGSSAYAGYMAFRCVLAHRAAATIYTCEVPGKVKQLCGNKRCVRLEHLKIAPKEHRPVYSEDTGRERVTPVFKQPDVIERVLSARPATGRYNVTALAKAAGTNRQTVQKVLREAALHDLIAEIRELIRSNKTVQREPLTAVSGSR